MLAKLVRSEAFPGILLVACAAVAVYLANSSWADPWVHAWHTPFSVQLGDSRIEKSLTHWINDGLMVLFFFFVGLEIKHEILDGSLRGLRQAVLPVAAAMCGMVVPALIYIVVTWRAPTVASGWGIPMATDIAFSLGVLALLGKRAPTSLKVFLAALAIADDLGAVLVIALFYTEAIAWQLLGLGAIVLVISYAANRLGVRKTWPYVVFGLVLWGLLLESGVHATIAGVALAFTVPARRALDEREFSRRGRQLLDEFDHVADTTPRTNDEQIVVVRELQRHAEAVQAPLQRMAGGLRDLVVHFVVPVFALANSGVNVGQGLAHAADHPAARGVFLGLLLGKPAGVMLAAWASTRWLGARLPEGASWRQLHGAAWLAGIGFTMSMFVDNLAFGRQHEAFDPSKVAILAASLASGLVGYTILRTGRGAS